TTSRAATSASSPSVGMKPGADTSSSLPVIDQYLAEVVASLDVPTNLREAVAYSLLGGGKRLRPILAWHACVAAGADGRTSLPAGAAVELVHAFSLVHDDLPAMDDDDFRRGRPTLHKATSEAMAILAGDGMLTMAFGVLVQRVATPAIAARLCGELVIGTQAMITGQVYDTLGGLPGNITDRDKLALIHRNKTGALLRAACRMGAICGQASERTLEALSIYADAMGLMFQVVDDLIDVTQDASHAGKATGKDAAKGKLTYPGLIGVEQSRAEVSRLLALGLDAIKPLGPSAQPLADLAQFMSVRTK
ncbi:MAG: polyprenyl synthetase family protein, partial [Phycisphaerales bacterium]|nr:polyprenyl synthetase family protein [Phycisphaerales bacterium]